MGREARLRGRGAMAAGGENGAPGSRAGETVVRPGPGGRRRLRLPLRDGGGGGARETAGKREGRKEAAGGGRRGFKREVEVARTGHKGLTGLAGGGDWVRLCFGLDGPQPANGPMIQLWASNARKNNKRSIIQERR